MPGVNGIPFIDTKVNGLPFGSVSFASGVITTDPSSATVYGSGLATGAPLGATVTVIVAAFEIAPSLSFMVYVVVAVPPNPATGTKVTVPSRLAVKVPCPAMVILANPLLNNIDPLLMVPFPSTSVSAVAPVPFPAITGMITLVLFGVLAVSLFATGASFTGVTETLTFPVEVTNPSLTP